MTKHYAKSGEEITEGWWVINFNGERCVAHVRNYDGVFKFSTPWVGGDAPEIIGFEKKHKGFEIIRKLYFEALASETLTKKEN